LLQLVVAVVEVMTKGLAVVDLDTKIIILLFQATHTQ
jgi:hypothetical protein